MVELTSYGLTALVAILVVAFCFACKDDSTSFESFLAHLEALSRVVAWLAGTRGKHAKTSWL
jgi:hypothetical protein